MGRAFISIAAVSSLIAVIVGAFAAHGLKSLISPEALHSVQIGAQYQMYHALALLAIGIMAQLKTPIPGLKASGIAFILGSLLFSGSLYALAAGAPHWLGPVTPLGGLCFMLGWLRLALGAWRGNRY